MIKGISLLKFSVVIWFEIKSNKNFLTGLTNIMDMPTNKNLTTPDIELGRV